MKQGKIFVAYKLLERLNRIPGLPFALSCQLYMLKKSLLPYYEAQVEREQVLFEASGIDENGQVLMTPELKKSIADIMKTEIDFKPELVKLQITPEITEKLGITGEIIEQLEDFVQFVEVAS